MIEKFHMRRRPSGPAVMLLGPMALSAARIGNDLPAAWCTTGDPFAPLNRRALACAAHVPMELVLQVRT